MPIKIKPDETTGIFYASGTLGGERIRASLRTRDRQAARKAAAAIEREYWADRASGRKEVVTFEMAALAYMQADGDKRFLAPLIQHFAGWPVDQIMPGHVEDAARALYPGRKPATWNRNVITPVRAILRHAAERGWCSAPVLRRFKEEAVKRKAADRAWLDAFMAAALEVDHDRGPYLAALAMFMAQTGARIGDALALRWADLDGRRGHGQSKTGRREYVLSREMMLRLQALERRNARVFYWSQRSSVYPFWYAAIDRAEIERFSPHQAGRHTFATDMIVRKGVDAKTAADLGGWKSPRMLMERYAHSEDLESVVDKVFGAPKPKEAKDG